MSWYCSQCKWRRRVESLREREIKTLGYIESRMNPTIVNNFRAEGWNECMEYMLHGTEKQRKLESRS